MVKFYIVALLSDRRADDVGLTQPGIKRILDRTCPTTTPRTCLWRGLQCGRVADSDRAMARRRSVSGYGSAPSRSTSVLNAAGR